MNSNYLTYARQWLTIGIAQMAVCGVTGSLTSTLRAQAPLYDNTNHTYHNIDGTQQMRWIGPQNSQTLFTAMPFQMGGHDNIASVTIPLARNIDSDATGTFEVSIWDANEDGRPGQEVGSVGSVDVESLERFDFPNNLPETVPEVRLDAPLGDLVPGDTYFLMMDYRGLDSIQFGDVIHGLSKSPIGSNRPGDWLISLTADEPPFGSNEWQSVRGFQGEYVYSQMSIEAAGTPYSSIPCAVGEVYTQDFDGLVVDEGDSGRILPQGWAFTDDPVYSADGRHLESGVVYTNFINDSFPAPSRLEPGSTLYGAGEPGKPDRSLALGVPRTAGEATIQLVADVVGEDASSFHLAFDIEAWDAASSRDNPGEAAFNVALDLNSGDGFRQIMDLGQVTTGVTLVPPTEDFVNGNDDIFRTSFDSGPLNLDLPEGSQLRVRWTADLEAETRGWVFGLDNVSLGMFDESVPILGDYDGDGHLSPGDIDLLSGEINGGSVDLTFDANADGIVDINDHQHWITSSDYANKLIGDADFDGHVDFPDFLALSAGFGQNGGWAQGDFDGNGEVDFPDFLALSANFGQSSAAIAAASVPEPSSIVLLGIGVIAIPRLRRFALIL